MTMAEEIFNQYTAEALKCLQHVRCNVRVKTYLDRQENETRRYTYSKVHRAKATKVSLEELGLDPFL